MQQHKIQIINQKQLYRPIVMLLVQINQLVGRINGAFGTLNYNPIHFINQLKFESSELCALYNLADVCDRRYLYKYQTEYTKF